VINRFFARANDVDCSLAARRANHVLNGYPTPSFETDSRNFNKGLLVGERTASAERGWPYGGRRQS
jgi:hypothetical protein